MKLRLLLTLKLKLLLAQRIEAMRNMSANFSLRNQPIVVLSNNDSCVIARSNEPKTLGIKMGEPYFKIKALSEQYKIHMFSSNYTLYGDLSQRVMSVIESMWTDVEVY